MVMQAGERSEELAARAAAGDREAFEELAGACRGRLEALIRGRLAGERPPPAAGVEDILQETFLRALRSIARFRWRDEDSFVRWLGGIACKVLLEARKAAAKARTRSIAIDLEPAAEHVSPSRRLQREERLARLEKALAELSPDHRRVLTLVRLEGLTIAEAAARMGRTPNALSQLLLRALRKLRERFGDTESLGLPGRPLRRSRGGKPEGIS
jgi:RNA polymerase sigma factor (sigma-70 family)